MMLPSRERISISHGCRTPPVQFAATPSERWCCPAPHGRPAADRFSPPGIGRQVGQGVRLFIHRLVTELAAGRADGRGWSGHAPAAASVRHPRQTGAPAVEKFDPQMPTFQQLPRRGRQASVGRKMDFTAFAERMIRSEPRFGNEIVHSDCQFAGRATYRKRTVDGVPNSMLAPFGINMTSPALAISVSPDGAHAARPPAPYRFRRSSASTEEGVLPLHKSGGHAAAIPVGHRSVKPTQCGWAPSKRPNFTLLPSITLMPPLPVTESNPAASPPAPWTASPSSPFPSAAPPGFR